MLKSMDMNYKQGWKVSHKKVDHDKLGFMFTLSRAGAQAKSAGSTGCHWETIALKTIQGELKRIK